MKWFKIYGEKWFIGSTRWELTIEQRAVWVDLLARASINDTPGQIDYFSLKQLADQFNVPLKLLKSTIKRCIEEKKINLLPKKRIILILSWKKYQSEYQRQVPYRKQDRSNSKVTNINDKACNKVTLRKEGEGEEKRKDKTILDKTKGDNSENPITPNPIKSEVSSPILSNSNSLKETGMTKKEQFLSILRGFKGYPFDEVRDSVLFDIAVKECPGINIIKQTEKKIDWWKSHPKALKANPRGKLQKWFKEEFKFQKRGGPQKIGEILAAVNDPDHRNFLKEALIGDKE